MTWEKKKILVTVKAYPERSKTYGTSVCTAGITDKGEWIRLYPISMLSFIGSNKISKYFWIEAECKKNTKEKLKRKESYKVREGSIRIVDTSLSKPRVDWEGRCEILLPHVDPSLEDLADRFKEDKTSLGLIKPKELIKFYTTEEPELMESTNAFIQALTGEKIPVVNQIPHIFKYKYRCDGCESGHEHNMQCEDWELLESYRRWSKRYKSKDELWEKIYYKFYTKMINEKDLYFFVGTESLYGRWLIIGVFYPPNISETAVATDEERVPKKMTLDHFLNEGTANE